MGIIKNIVTLGASYRVDKKMEEYKIIESKYRNLVEEYVEKRNKMKYAVDELTTTKVNAIKSLRKVSKITDQLIIYSGSNNDPKINVVTDYKFSYISETISHGQAAMTAAGGIATGVGSAVGTWALASTFGIASTGTAIGGISGVAASNATMALLGGGSLAAGGGGMAAGMMTMTGVFAIPAIIFTGVFSHMSANKKIQKMSDAMVEMTKAIPIIEKDFRSVNEYLNTYYSSIVDVTNTVRQLTYKFDVKFRYNYKKIYRIPLISRMKKWLRMKVLRRSYYSDKDFEYIYEIVEIAEKLASSINKKIV